MRFAEKVRQSKTQVKSWIPEMNHFVVEQDQFAVVNESVLWAEIAVHQTVFVIERFPRQVAEECAGFGHPLGRIEVVWFYSETLEICGVGERVAKFRARRGRFAVYCPEEQAELLEMIRDYPPGKQDRFPIVVWLGDRCHAQQMIRHVFEEESRSGPRRAQPIETTQGFCLHSNPLRTAEPVYVDSQFRQRLF